MKVYISSTYQDLIEYRAAVDRTLRRMGHDVIGMEQYVAEGSKPVERCKADVRASDVYVIIVAWRYGYVPGHTALPPDPRSITQIELEEAQTCGKAVLAFLLDPEAPWPLNRVDAMGGVPGVGEEVSSLRTLLGSTYLAGIFRTPDDLASQVAAAVSAQGITRRMIDRVLGQTAAAKNMGAFARGEQPINTSSVVNIKDMVKIAIEEAGASRTLILELGKNQIWWSTRLFLLASLLRSLTTVRQIVFCDSNDHFVGMASPGAIIDGLCNAFQLLDQILRQIRSGTATLDVGREINRQLQVWESFVDPPSLPNNAQNFPLPNSEEALKVDVRAPLLQQWLGERWISRSIQVDSHDLSMSDVQQIVDSLIPDVPVERHRRPPESGTQLMVVDRDAFALELAREWVRSGLPRSPVR